MKNQLKDNIGGRTASPGLNFFSRGGGFTLIEVMVVMMLSIMLLISVWQLFRMITRTQMYTQDEISVQRAVRVIVERIKNDLRAAVFPDGLIGDKFIIQDPVDINGKEVGGARIRFARFHGFDDKGKPIVEKVVYIFDRGNGRVKRANWSGTWEQKNDSVENEKIVDSLSSLSNSTNGSYLFFNTFYTDTDREGFKGRLFVFIGLKGVYGNDVKIKHEIKLDLVVGPRFITSKDREPFWNLNPMSRLNVEDFQK
jgi:type II secretory pathway pseudopilin PulG